MLLQQETSIINDEHEMTVTIPVIPIESQIEYFLKYSFIQSWFYHFLPQSDQYTSRKGQNSW